MPHRRAEGAAGSTEGSELRKRSFRNTGSGFENAGVFGESCDPRHSSTYPSFLAIATGFDWPGGAAACIAAINCGISR
jgi:hypothetical protein